MKNYSGRTFTNVNDLLKWLNENSTYINVVSIMYLDRISQFEVIYYTENTSSWGHRGMG